MKSITLPLSCAALACWTAMLCSAQTIHLPTSKEILGSVPGNPQRLNSLPLSAAWSPDHRYLALVNAGFGTVESNYEQSIAILDTSTGKLTDFPDERTGIISHQTLYSGIAFSADGSELYASLDSISAPEGGKPGETGNAIAVYRFTGDNLTPVRLIPVPLRELSGEQKQQHGEMDLPQDKAIPAPTGLAVVKGADGTEKLLVADEFSDDVLLLDAASGRLETRFDLSDGPTIPSTYPIAVLASPDGQRAWVSLWNGSAVAELDLRSGKVKQRLPLLPPIRPTDPSSHPIAMTLSADGTTLYVALANRDAVAVVPVTGGKMRLADVLDARLP
ncbi:MAG: phosphoesterase, partial [Acidobacteriaceae bacterium]